MILKQNSSKSTVSNSIDRTCVVESNDLSYSNVVKKIKENAKLNEDKIRINSIIETTTGKTVIKCKDSTDLDKLLINCSAVGVPVRKPKPKSFRFIVKGLPIELKNLVVRNGDNFDYEALINVLTVRHHKADELKKSFKVFKMFESKNGSIAKIFYLDEDQAKLLRDDRDFYVYTRRYRASPYYHLYQCFKCCELHHIAKDCKSSAICGNCAGDHETRSCTSNLKQCSLCKASGDHKNGAHTHGSRDGNCPLKTALIKTKSLEQWELI